MSASPTPRGPIRRFLSAIRESLSGEHHDYTRGSLRRAITLLAIPMMLEMSMEALFAVVDIWFVNRLGSAAVATVGLTESMMTIVYAIAIGLAMGTTATVARRVGEQNLTGAAAAGGQAIWLGITLGVGLGLPAALLAPQLLAAMKASDEVIEVGTGYATLMLGSNVVILLLFINNAVFRGAGDAVVAMRSLWLANSVNLVLDPCLIFGVGPFPELGLTGAAVATTIGRGSGVLYQTLALRRGHARFAVRGAAMRIDLPAMGRLLWVSMGGIGQMLIATSSWVVMMRIMARFGDDALAGYTIAIRILIFSLLPSWGLGNAAATLVGQSLGAGDPGRAERAVWWSGLFNMAFLGVVTLVFLFASPVLLDFFTDDPAVRAIGAEALRVISYGYVVYGWGMILTQAFNGAGDTRTPTWINFVCFWLIQIPLAYGLAVAVEMGPNGVFWAIMLAESVLAVVAAVVFRRGAWKRVEV